MPTGLEPSTAEPQLDDSTTTPTSAAGHCGGPEGAAGGEKERLRRRLCPADGMSDSRSARAAVGLVDCHAIGSRKGQWRFVYPVTMAEESLPPGDE